MKADAKGVPHKGRVKSRASGVKIGMAALPIDSLDCVARRLRSAYDSTFREPLPVRLTDLLERLSEHERCRTDDLIP
jgi:hypothetical protein